MSRARLRSGDMVVVIAGNEKGRVGKLLSYRGKDRVLIEGVNIRKKHMRPTQQQQKGRIIEIEAPVHISNIKHAVDGEGVKLKVRFNTQGEKELYYRKGSEETFFRMSRASSKKTK